MKSFANSVEMISIHALREEGDKFRACISAEVPSFLSTPSARRATPRAESAPTAQSNFYPRPPRGGRLWAAQAIGSQLDFYPRPPRGGRQVTAEWQSSKLANFYPRPPRGGRHALADKEV